MPLRALTGRVSSAVGARVQGGAQRRPPHEAVLPVHAPRRGDRRSGPADKRQHRRVRRGPSQDAGGKTSKVPLAPPHGPRPLESQNTRPRNAIKVLKQALPQPLGGNEWHADGREVCLPLEVFRESLETRGKAGKQADDSSVWSENGTELLSSVTGTTIYMREVNYDLSIPVISAFLMSTWTCSNPTVCFLRTTKSVYADKRKKEETVNMVLKG